MPDESDEATLDLANTLVRERLESQKSGIERTETKTTLLLGFGLVGLQFVLTRSRHRGWMLVAAIFYGLSLLSGAWRVCSCTSTTSRRTLSASSMPIWSCRGGMSWMLSSGREQTPSTGTPGMPGSRGGRGSVRWGFWPSLWASLR